MTDKQVLSYIEQMYQLDAGPDWHDALVLVMTIFEATGAVLLEEVAGGFMVRARHGQAFEWQSEPLLKRGTGQNKARIGLHTRHDEQRYVWLFDGVSRQPRSRINAIRTNLRQAVDFSEQRRDAARPVGRLLPATPRRIAQVTRLLQSLPARPTGCVLLAARGYTNGQISDYLQIAPGSVARCLQEAYRHLGVAGRSDLDIPVLLTLPKPAPAW